MFIVVVFPLARKASAAYIPLLKQGHCSGEEFSQDKICIYLWLAYLSMIWEECENISSYVDSVIIR
jgi:hypothetical protein